MPIPALALLAISSATLVTEGVLRSGCESDDRVLATLAAGTTVEIQSALSMGNGKCFKVTTQQNGQSYTGYLPEKAVGSVEAFEQARRNARGLGGGAAGPAVKEMAGVVRQAGGKAGGTHPAQRALELLEANQPGEALRLVEKELQRYTGDPYLLAVAGMAYYRMDNLDRAILLWKESLAIESNAGIENLIRRAEQEKAADKGSERMVGTRVVLRYEKTALTQPYALAMLQVLDEEYSRIAAALGCRATEKVTAIAQSRGTYFASTRAAEWSGGQYDGRIHVPVTESRQVPGQTRQVFAHELVHACLHELGTWPSWLHEGMAQKYSGVSMDATARGSFDALVKAKKLPKLSAMGNGWGGMSGGAAATAYGYALYAVERLLEFKASTGLGNVLRNPAEFSRTEAELEKALGF